MTGLLLVVIITQAALRRTGVSEKPAVSGLDCRDPKDPHACPYHSLHAGHDRHTTVKGGAPFFVISIL